MREISPEQIKVFPAVKLPIVVHHPVDLCKRISQQLPAIIHISLTRAQMGPLSLCPHVRLISCQRPAKSQRSRAGSRRTTASTDSLLGTEVFRASLAPVPPSAGRCWFPLPVFLSSSRVRCRVPLAGQEQRCRPLRPWPCRALGHGHLPSRC